MSTDSDEIGNDHHNVNANDVTSDEYEDSYVTVTIPNAPVGIDEHIFLAAYSVDIQNILSSNPKVVINDMLHFTGSYELNLGSRMVFTEEDAEVIGHTTKRMRLDICDISDKKPIPTELSIDSTHKDCVEVEPTPPIPA